MARSMNCRAIININAFFLFIVFFCLGLFFLFWQAFCLAQGLSDDPLQLAVGAAELVRSPGLYSVHRLSVNAEDKTLGVALLCHVLMV